MQKKHEVFKKVLEAISDGEIKWVVAPAGNFDDVIQNPEFTTRCFKGAWGIGEKEYTVLFLEEKIPDEDMGFNRWDATVLVLLERNVVVSISTQDEERSIFVEMMEDIENQTEQIDDLLSS